MRFNSINILFSIFLSTFAFGQTTQYPDHYKKYWYFKSRLNNDFLKIGLDSGESIPFNQRGHNATGFSIPNAKTDMLAGDAAATLGYYIATLATEYKLLQVSNQKTDKIKHELFCALSAINRIDYKAEGTIQYGSEKLNGFFIRDDIPKNFVRKNYSHFNYFSDWNGNIDQSNLLPVNNNTHKGFASQMENGVFKTYSNWQGSVQGNGSKETTYESQDQVYNLLFGLAFVSKFIPMYETDNGNTFGYGSGETSLKQEAINITNRIVNHIRNPKDLNNNDCGNPGNTFPNNWRIRNPATCNLVDIGNNAEAFAYAIAESQCFINGGLSLGNGTITFPPNPLVTCPGSGYHNLFSQTAGRAIWGLTIDTYLGLPNCPNQWIDNRVFATNLQAICNCSYGNIIETVIDELQYVLKQVPLVGEILADVVGWVWQWVQIAVTKIVPIVVNNTWSNILLNAYSPGASLDHGPLARKILHGGIYQPNINYSMDYQLDQAPCDNIFNLTNGLNSGIYWSSDNRLDHPNRSNLSASQPSTNLCIDAADLIPGEYNGIDFLLYHNLWYIHKWQEQGNLNTPFIDLSDVYINKNGGIISNQANPSDNIIAYETITSENTIFKYNGIFPAYWRAGKTIELKPGTEITSNSNLHAYIQKFNCATNLGQFKPGKNDSSSSHEINIVPYHYVLYPNENTTKVNSESEINVNYISEIPKEIEEINSSKITVKAGEFAVYPNPSNSTTSIYFNLSENETASIKFADLTGRILFEKNNLNSTKNVCELELSNYKMGSYLLTYSTSSGITKNLKIIKTN